MWRVAGALYIAAQRGGAKHRHAGNLFRGIVFHGLTGGIAIEQVFNAGETLVDRPEKKIARLQSGEK